MDTPFIGQIKPYPYNFAPQGWALCNGSLLQIVTNQALYSLIGTKFGGDGRTTFALPDLRGADVDNVYGNGNCHYYIALQGLYPPRS